MIKEIISKIVITEIIRMFAIIKKTVTDAITEITAAEKIIAQGSKVWVNTIWASLCGGDGNDDDAAFQCKDPGEVYQQYMDAGVSMIQTDRPELIIGWLTKVGRHTLK